MSNSQRRLQIPPRPERQMNCSVSAIAPEEITLMTKDSFISGGPFDDDSCNLLDDVKEASVAGGAETNQ